MSENQQQPEFIDHDASRRNARVTALVVVAIVVIGAAVGLVVGLLRSGDDGHHHPGGVARVLIVVAVLVAVLGIGFPLILRLYRRPQYARVLQYGWRQRRRVGKALRKARPIAPEDRPVADALVRTMRQQRWLPYLFGIIVVVYLAQALFDHGFQREFAVVLLALYVVLLPWMVWQRRTIFANYDRLEPTEHPGTAPA